MQELRIIRLVPPPEELQELYRQEKDSRLKERYHAIYLMHLFANAKKVAQLLGRDKSTILSWIKAFNEIGLEGLTRESPPGKKSRLSSAQQEDLKKDLVKNPRELGYEFSNWDGKTIGSHIHQKFGVQLGVRAVQKLLHKLGFSLQRPKPQVLKANPTAQQTFQDQLKKKWLPLGQRISSSTPMNVASNMRLRSRGVGL